MFKVRGLILNLTSILNIVGFLYIFSKYAYVAEFLEKKDGSIGFFIFVFGIFMGLMIGYLPLRLGQMFKNEKFREKFLNSEGKSKLDLITILVFFALPSAQLISLLVLMTFIYPKMIEYYMKFK